MLDIYLFDILLFFRHSSVIGLLNSAIKEMGNRNVLSAFSLFEQLPKFEIANFEKLKADVKMLKEKERCHIFDLLDKIMISLNEISLESITLPIFKYWCDLFIFEYMLFMVFQKFDKPSNNLNEIIMSVNLKVSRFFFKALIHFKKLNIKIVDDNIVAQKSESLNVICKEKLLILVIERIENCETVKDLIDASPTKECPVCWNVTFTESTPFKFRLTCNHLVCISCQKMLDKLNKTLVKIYIISCLLIS